MRRIPFLMLWVDCIDGINIYYQMMEHIVQCIRDFSVCYIQYTPAMMVKKLLLCHRSCECFITCRERKKEHSNEVAHCLTEYLERLLHNTNYERNLKIEYHDELSVNVSRTNRAILKFLNGIVKRRVCKRTDPMHTHKVNLVVKHQKLILTVFL